MLHYHPGLLEACDHYKRCSLVAAEAGQPPLHVPPGVLSERNKIMWLIIKAD